MVSPADSRLAPRRLLRAFVLLAAALACVFAAPAAPALAADGPGYDRPADPRPPTSKLAWLARITSESDVYAAPARSALKVGRVTGTTSWGSGTQLLIRGSARTAGELWLDVRLQGRPNGRHGWIPGNAATLKRTGQRILVNRRARTITLLNRGRAIKRARVVIGAAATPTPAGTYAVADKLQLAHGRAFLGSWVLPLTAYSDVLKNFDGGIGQVALHGRGGASLKTPLGKAASHGCVRISNDVIGAIAERVPIGTPVTIV